MRIFSLLLLLLSLPFSAHAEKEGPIVSGGGSGQTAEFYRIARGLTYGLFSYKEEIRPQFSLVKLQEIVNLLQVEATTEQLFKDEAPVEALNYPDLPKVRFNSTAWGNRTRMGRVRLVMHELLGLLQVPDPQYTQSDFLAEQVDNNFGDVAEFTAPSVDGVEGSENPITCTIYGQSPGDIAARFPLEIGAEGASATASFRGYFTEVYISLSKSRQIRAGIYRLGAENRINWGEPELEYTANVVGDFVSLSARGPHFSISCLGAPTSALKPYIRKQ